MVVYLNNYRNMEKQKTLENLQTTKEELKEEQKEYLESVKNSIIELFGQETLPKELVTKLVEVRVDIRDKVGREEYVESLSDANIQAVQSLFIDIIQYNQNNQEQNLELVGITSTESDDGVMKQMAVFGDGTQKELDAPEQELLESLTKYFDAYRMTYNAVKFNRNFNDTQKDIISENQERKLNFYSEDAKKEVFIERIFKKYKKADFSKEDIENIVDIFELDKLDDLPVHKISVTKQVVDVFSKFMKGDKSKYVGLSTALLVPAYVNGVTPMFLANAFGKTGMDKTQIALYALLTGTSIASSLIIEKHFKDFLDKNFQKEDGYAQHISQNATELPGEEVESFGSEQIKQRIANAKWSYEQILRSLSFNILPSSVTLGTSAYMLYDKSPILAAGTVAGTGIMMMLNNFVHKKGRFWSKEQKARQTAEEMSQKIQELISAHMEVTLSGEKDKFVEEMDELLSKERVSMSDRNFLEVVRHKVMQSYSVLNFISASVATAFAGGAPDKFIAALVYSGNFNTGVNDILGTTHRLAQSARDTMELEILFNGYAHEEKEKEAHRIGMSELDNYDIDIRDVSVAFRDKYVLRDINLNIKSGEMVEFKGASGAGKTTLMKVISGYYKPTGGEVNMGGVDLDNIKKSGPDSIYSKVGYLAQFPYILEDSVRDNLTFGVSGEITDTNIREVLKEVGLQQRLKDLNEKLSGGRGDSASLSGGESSRLGLARIILKIRTDKPKVVFFDEPTASVDEEMAQQIAQIINKEKKNNPDTTFIIISHDKNLTDNLDTNLNVKMKDGQIIVK